MPRLPFPATSGRKTSLYHYCRILSEELGYRLIVAAFLEKGDNPQLKPEFIDRLEILPKPSATTKIKNIFVDSILLKKKPMQVSLYWNPNARVVIDKIVQEEQPDIIIGDMVRSTEYIKNYPIYRIADLDDRISLRYQRQLDYDISGINPYGAFLNTVPKIVQKIVLWKPLKVYVVKNEIKLLKKYELEIAKQCDKTVLVAQKEADDIVKEAENRIISMIDEHEITRKAYEQKAEIIETANEMSREISKGTKDYADSILANIETALQGALETIQNNRKELQ